MKKLLLFLIIFTPSILLAQYPGSTFSKEGWVLVGETEIVLKDGSKVSCHDKIKNTTIGKTDIDYANVDYIRLVKTKLRGFESHNINI